MADPLHEFRPVAVPAQFYVFGPLLAGFLAFVPSFIMFVFSNIVLGARDPVFAFALLVFIPAFGGVLWLMAQKTFKEPTVTRYAVYADRVETEEGLWNKHRRTVLFDQVVDIELTEGVLQQTVGAGTVTLVMRQLFSGGEGPLLNRRISLTNLPEPRKVYDLLRNLALRKPAP